MLAYAANRPRAAASKPSPNAMLAIIAVHVTLIAVLMSAKMDLPRRILEPPTTVQLLPQPTPPPPKPVHPQTPTHPIEPTIDQPTVKVPTQPTTAFPTIDLTPLPNIGDLIGGGGNPVPRVDPPVRIKLPPQLATPESELKPPYPQAKILSGEEAVLTLRLTIDERGRVVAVAPIGRADLAFLEAARRHLLAHWRYKPATVDGRATPSSAVVTLHFQLDG